MTRSPKSSSSFGFSHLVPVDCNNLLGMWVNPQNHPLFAATWAQWPIAWWPGFALPMTSGLVTLHSWTWRSLCIWVAQSLVVGGRPTTSATLAPDERH